MVKVIIISDSSLDRMYELAKRSAHQRWHKSSGNMDKPRLKNKSAPYFQNDVQTPDDFRSGKDVA